jgi:hypothetical protein
MDKRASATIELDFPITIAGVEVTTVTMRRPKVRDELAMQKSKASDAEKAVILIASLCELTPDEVYELDAADFAKLERQYVDFRGGSQSADET